MNCLSGHPLETNQHIVCNYIDMFAVLPLPYIHSTIITISQKQKQKLFRSVLLILLPLYCEVIIFCGNENEELCYCSPLSWQQYQNHGFSPSKSMINLMQEKKTFIFSCTHPNISCFFHSKQQRTLLWPESHRIDFCCSFWASKTWSTAVFFWGRLMWLPALRELRLNLSNQVAGAIGHVFVSIVLLEQLRTFVSNLLFGLVWDWHFFWEKSPILGSFSSNNDKIWTFFDDFYELLEKSQNFKSFFQNETLWKCLFCFVKPKLCSKKPWYKQC